MTFGEIDTKVINTARVFAADVVAKANSGHPGAPMSLSPLAYLLWQYTMKFNPKNPSWYNRDRFVLSNGHACVLQYMFMYFYGYDYTLDDLKHFRQLNSKTPGHPEAELPGVEVTTGPLGQGIANAVGLAIAGKQVAAEFNKPDFELLNNKVFAFLGDGCLMEGISHEAMSLAGHLQLDNLVAFWDDNHITIDGDTACAFTEDVCKRMEAYGWHIITVKNGNTDIASMYEAIQTALKVTGKPVFVRVETIIGYGSLKEGDHSVHGSPLKPDDVKHVKKLFGFDPEESFVIPSDVKEQTSKKIAEGAKLEEEWNAKLEAYSKKYTKEAEELKRRIARKLPTGWEKSLPTYKVDDKALASRKLSELALTAIHEALPELIGGSADLTGSNLTRWPGAVDFQPPSTKLGDWSGRYIRYGVREHGMGAIMNGISAYGGLIPYGGTFLNFVSYGAGAVRLSALSGHNVIWVATHDSIGLGEDGPTHQPIETLAHLRAIPNLMVWRPADGNEVSAAYKVSIEREHTPSVIALSRQGLPQLSGSSIEKASKGGYVVYEPETKPEVILAATGSEVSISVSAAESLKGKIAVRVVSLPDFFTFDGQSEEYKLSVFPDGIPAVSVEVMSAFGWSKYTHENFNLDHFGASAPAGDIYKALEFTPEGVSKRVEATVAYYKGQSPKSRIHHAFAHLVQRGPGPFSSK